MLAQEDLLVSSCRCFSDHHVFHDVNLEDIWQRSLNACRQRLKQLQNGLALAEGIKDLAELEDLDEAPETEITEGVLELEVRCPWCSHLNLCGVRD